MNEVYRYVIEGLANTSYTDDIKDVLTLLDAEGDSMKTVRLHTRAEPTLEGSALGIARSLRDRIEKDEKTLRYEPCGYAANPGRVVMSMTQSLWDDLSRSISRRNELESVIDGLRQHYVKSRSYGLTTEDEAVLKGLQEDLDVLNEDVVNNASMVVDSAYWVAETDEA